MMEIWAERFWIDSEQKEYHVPCWFIVLICCSTGNNVLHKISNSLTSKYLISINSVGKCDAQRPTCYISQDSLPHHRNNEVLYCPDRWSTRFDTGTKLKTTDWYPNEAERFLSLYMWIKYIRHLNRPKATRYGLDGPEIEFRWGWDFRTCPDQPWGPPSLLYNRHRVFAGGSKAAGAWPSPPTPSIAEVKERVELNFYPPSGPSWPVLGWTLPLALRPFNFISNLLSKRKLQFKLLIYFKICIVKPWDTKVTLTLRVCIPLSIADEHLTDDDWSTSKHVAMYSYFNRNYNGDC